MRLGKATRRIKRSIKPKPLSLKTGRVSPKSKMPRASYTKRRSYKIK